MNLHTHRYTHTLSHMPSSTRTMTYCNTADEKGWEYLDQISRRSWIFLPLDPISCLLKTLGILRSVIRVRLEDLTWNQHTKPDIGQGSGTLDRADWQDCTGESCWGTDLDLSPDIMPNLSPCRTSWGKQTLISSTSKLSWSACTVQWEFLEDIRDVHLAKGGILQQRSGLLTWRGTETCW